MGILNIANIEDRFAQVVDSIRETGTITSSSVSGVFATLQSVNNLQNGDVITIGTTDYKVSGVSSTEFKVKSSIDLSGDWKAKAPYFMDGHLREISKRLSEKDQSTGLIKFEKYPLIVLLQDFTMEEKVFNANMETTLNIVILNNTQPTYDTTQRRDNNFTPILDPIYNDLIKAIKNDPFLNLTDSSWNLTRRYYWGSELNDKNIFGDHLDAIEISNLNLQITKKC